MSGIGSNGLEEKTLVEDLKDRLSRLDSCYHLKLEENIKLKKKITVLRDINEQLEAELRSQERRG